MNDSKLWVENDCSKKKWYLLNTEIMIVVSNGSKILSFTARVCRDISF